VLRINRDQPTLDMTPLAVLPSDTIAPPYLHQPSRTLRGKWIATVLLMLIIMGLLWLGTTSDPGMLVRIANVPVLPLITIGVVGLFLSVIAGIFYSLSLLGRFLPTITDWLQTAKVGAFVGLGNLCASLHLYKTALWAYELALSLKPRLSKAYHGQSEVYKRLAQRESAKLLRQAQRAYEKAKELGVEPPSDDEL
jgi:hypothetical protein